MYNFNHLHILTLKGVCLDGGPAPYIIMPFMANGSLLVYLKENRDKLIVSFKDKDEEDVRNEPCTLVLPCPFSTHASRVLWNLCNRQPGVLLYKL